MHFKFDPPGFRTHDLQIMTVPFHVPEMPALTTRASELFHEDFCSLIRTNLYDLFNDQPIANYIV